MFEERDVLFLLLAYFTGAIPFGVIVSRIVTGQDVRKQGSGNIGATNVARLMGKKWGILVLFLDALKGWLAVEAALWLAGSSVTPWRAAIFPNLVAVCAVVGHCYPVYLKFKGGKGVATALGVLLALSPSVIGIAFAVFLVTVLVSRRISPASLLAALAAPVAAFLLNGRLLSWSALVIAAIVWWKHRENIKRLLAGTEPKFF